MENESDRQRTELLQAAAALIATRDELLMCAELLRDYQFDTDSEGRCAATDSANEIIGKLRCAPTTKHPE